MSNAASKAIGLVKSLLEYAGIDAEGFEETNKALVSLDREITMLIVVENRLIHLIGVIGPIVIDSEELLSALLHENFKSVAEPRYRYAIEPESGDLLMSRTLQSELVDNAAFIDEFLRMAQYVGQWSRSLAGGGVAVPQPDEAAAAVPEIGGAAFDRESTSGPGFVRV